MDVSSATGRTAAPASTTPTSAVSSFDANAFLQLLIAQVKNQDPTNPTDASQYVQQFATLAQVEQSTQSNKKLDAILAGIEGLRADLAKDPSADQA